MHLDQLFAVVVTVLAALAVVGALVLAIVAEVVAIRRKVSNYRQSPQDATESFWRGRGVAVPGVRKWQ